MTLFGNSGTFRQKTGCETFTLGYAFEGQSVDRRFPDSGLI
jgi:hypothetical protein